MLIQTLKNRADFLRLAQSGESWVSKTVIIQRAPRQHDKENSLYFGYTATRKTLNKAVARNRAKRRLRAAVRHFLDNLPHDFASQLTAHDYVLIARADTVTCKWDDLLKDLQWCFKRLSQK